MDGTRNVIQIVLLHMLKRFNSCHIHCTRIKVVQITLDKDGHVQMSHQIQILVFLTGFGTVTPSLTVEETSRLGNRGSPLKCFLIGEHEA